MATGDRRRYSGRVLTFEGGVFDVEGVARSTCSFLVRMMHTIVGESVAGEGGGGGGEGGGGIILGKVHCWILTRDKHKK